MPVLPTLADQVASALVTTRFLSPRKIKATRKSFHTHKNWKMANDARLESTAAKSIGEYGGNSEAPVPGSRFQISRGSSAM